MSDESSCIKCNVCEANDAVYELILEEDVECPFCGYIKYTKGDDKIILCSTECKNLYWWITIGKNNEADVMMEKDECNRCGKRDFPCVRYSYKIIGTLPKVNNKKSFRKKRISLPVNQTKCLICNKKKIRYMDCKIMDLVQCTNIECNLINYMKDHPLPCMCSTKCTGSPWNNDMNEYLTDNNEDQTTQFTSSFICTGCDQSIDNIRISMTQCIVKKSNKYKHDT